MVKGDKENEQTKNYASLIYDVASMTGGYEIEDSGDFAKRVMTLMTTKANQDGVQEADVVDNIEDENEGQSDEAIEPEVIA
jgi:heat shock protein beta